MLRQRAVMVKVHRQLHHQAHCLGLRPARHHCQGGNAPAASLMMLRELRAAEEDCSSALRLCPDYVKAAQRLANVRTQRGKLSDAAESHAVDIAAEGCARSMWSRAREMRPGPVFFLHRNFAGDVF